MKLLLPMDRAHAKQGRLVPIAEVQTWGVLEIESGQAGEVSFHATREDVDDWLDAVVVVGEFEPVMAFIEEQMMVLVAPTQRSIEAIIEAYLFKELHELSF